MATGLESALFDQLASDPGSPIEGQVWWNTTEQALKIRRSGDTVTLLDGSDHPALRQLIHFIDEGPAEGFATGSYKETVGGVFPSTVTWYDQTGPTKKKIVEKAYTWTGAKATQIVWTIYDAAEVLLTTITDSITYSGVLEVSRTRAIT